MNADTPSPSSSMGLPRPELHFVRTRGKLEAIDGTRPVNRVPDDERNRWYSTGHGA